MNASMWMDRILPQSGRTCTNRHSLSQDAVDILAQLTVVIRERNGCMHNQRAPFPCGADDRDGMV